MRENMKYKKILTELKVFKNSVKKTSVVLLAASMMLSNLGYVNVQASEKTTIQKTAKAAQEEETTLDALKKLIKEADELKEEDYTAESWAEFKDVRDSIEDADEIPEKFQQTILNNLQEAIDGLQETTLKQLKDLIAEWYLGSNRRWSLLSDHPHESDGLHQWT